MSGTMMVWGIVACSAVTRAPTLRASCMPIFTARVDASEPSVGTRMCRNMSLATDQHRGLGVAEHLRGLAAEHEAAQRAAAVRGHHDQVAFGVLRRLDDAFPRLERLHANLRALHLGAGCAGNLRQRLVGDVL